MDKNTKITVIIDATKSDPHIKVFSISLLERNLRLLALHHIEEAIVLIPKEGRPEIQFRKDFGKFLPIKPVFIETDDSLFDKLNLAPETQVLFLEACAVYQDQLISTAIESNQDILFRSGKIETPCLAKFSFGHIKGKSMGNVSELNDHLVLLPFVHVRLLDDMRFYVASQRKTIAPFSFLIQNSKQAKDAEKFLFEITHYGSIDIVAKYFLKQLAKTLVTLIAKTSITPNQITYTSILFAFSVTPLFAMGMMKWALLCSVVVSILDVCDGKLARFTFRVSEKGDKLDHFADRINIYLYYISCGIGLYTAGYISDGFSATYLIVTLLVGHTLDKVMARWFRRHHGMRIHDFSELDAKSRLFLPRRNIFICFIIFGLAIGKPVEAYMAYIGWMFVYVVFHFMRVMMEKPTTSAERE